MQSVALLGILRESTRSHHQELDSSLRLGRLARGEVDLTFYVETLLRYRMCFESLESLLDSSRETMNHRAESSWLPDVVPYRQRLSALDNDLALLLPKVPEPLFALGAGIGPGSSGYLPKPGLELCADSACGPEAQWTGNPGIGRDIEADVGHHSPMHALSRTAPAEFELGVRYVLDGSSMGASVIHRQLLKTTGDMIRQASRFWEIQKRVGRDWPIIRNRLQDIVQEVDLPLARIQYVTTSARLCFQVFRRAFVVEGQR